MQWLSLANYGLMTGEGLREASEAPVHIDIIDNDRAARSQSSPCTIYLKANITFTVQAIMNKEIDLAELSKYAG